jgi:hypothetical protein
MACFGATCDAQQVDISVNLKSKLSLTQMVRFLVMELIHPGLNLRFDVGVTYLRLIILLVVDDVIIDNETLPVFQMYS